MVDYLWRGLCGMQELTRTWAMWLNARARAGAVPTLFAVRAAAAGLSYLLIFWHPGDVSITIMAVLALTGQFVFRLFFTMASTPYSSLMARMTQTPMTAAAWLVRACCLPMPVVLPWWF